MDPHPQWKGRQDGTIPSGKPVFVLSTEAGVGFPMCTGPGMCRHPGARICPLLPPSPEPIVIPKESNLDKTKDNRL